MGAILFRESGMIAAATASGALAYRNQRASRVRLGEPLRQQGCPAAIQPRRAQLLEYRAPECACMARALEQLLVGAPQLAAGLNPLHRLWCMTQGRQRCEALAAEPAVGRLPDL